MNVSDHDRERLISGVMTAVDMMVDDKLCAVLVVGVHNGGRGVKMWDTGDATFVNQLKAQLMGALPLTKSVVKQPSPVWPEDDGA